MPEAIRKIYAAIDQLRPDDPGSFHFLGDALEEIFDNAAAHGSEISQIGMAIEELAHTHARARNKALSDYVAPLRDRVMNCLEAQPK
jgi:hypothetical protein